MRGLMKWVDMYVDVAAVDRNLIVHVFPHVARYQFRGRLPKRNALRELQESSEYACGDRGWTFAGYVAPPELEQSAMDAAEYWED